jgi:hypothetical protein
MCLVNVLMVCLCDCLCKVEYIHMNLEKLAGAALELGSNGPRMPALNVYRLWTVSCHQSFPYSAPRVPTFHSDYLYPSLRTTSQQKRVLVFSPKFSFAFIPWALCFY